MSTVNSSKFLNNLYGLMMEVNLHREDEDILRELRESPDSQINEHLLRLKQLKAKLKAEANRVKFKTALNQLRILKEKGLSELKSLIKPSERAEFVPLFNKFEELTDQDQIDILDDQDLLKLLKVLKDRIEGDDSN